MTKDYTMKTKDILACEESKVVPALKQMKIKDLERHAKKILGKLGQDDYDSVLRAVIKTVPSLMQSTTTAPYQSIKEIIATYLPADSLHTVDSSMGTNKGTKIEQQNVDATSPNHHVMLDRLSAIVMLIVSKKFEKIHAENR